MRTIKRTYKTLNGFLNAVGKHTVSVYLSMGGYPLIKDGKRYELYLDDSAKEELGEYMAKEWSKRYHNFVVDAFKNSEGDFSYFQCFYIERYDGRIRIGNSLAGESFDYCKKMWKKSV
jgi:hypothetical protein